MGDWDRMVKFIDDRGSATVLALASIAAVMAVSVSVIVAGHLGLARGEAAMVADLAAVSAARHGNCGAAQRLAESHIARLVRCEFHGTDAIVQVALGGIRPSVAGFTLGETRAIARAGY